jgi:hypothetical protein
MTTPKKKQLKEFIDENDKLLTVFGVFGGLTGFFIQLRLDLLAFVSFFVFILLLIEVMSSFPKSEEASILLNLFQYAFLFMLIILGFYLVTTYRQILLQISYFLLFVLYSVIAIKVIPRQKNIGALISRIVIKNKKLSVIVVFTVLVILLFLAIESARLLQTFLG